LATFEPLTPERRRAMTRQYLLEAAAIVFARDGFHGATLDDIAALAGFSKGAVYSNFKSKDDLFLALLDNRIDLRYAATMEVLNTGSHDREDQLPRMRDLVSAQVFGDPEAWSALYLEFVLYARRNPDARTSKTSSNGSTRPPTAACHPSCRRRSPSSTRRCGPASAWSSSSTRRPSTDKPSTPCSACNTAPWKWTDRCLIDPATRRIQVARPTARARSDGGHRPYPVERASFGSRSGGAGGTELP
jgi:AcrR family transcriptional regulator